MISIIRRIRPERRAACAKTSISQLRHQTAFWVFRQLTNRDIFWNDNVQSSKVLKKDKKTTDYCSRIVRVCFDSSEVLCSKASCCCSAYWRLERLLSVVLAERARHESPRMFIIIAKLRKFLRFLDRYWTCFHNQHHSVWI